MAGRFLAARPSANQVPLIATAAVALIAGMPAQAQEQERPGEGRSITMARPSWDTGWFQTEIYSQLLRELSR